MYVYAGWDLLPVYRACSHPKLEMVQYMSEIEIVCLNWRELFFWWCTGQHLQ